MIFLLFPVLGFVLLLTYIVTYFRAIRGGFREPSLDRMLLISGGVLVPLLVPLGLLVLGDLLFSAENEVVYTGLSYIPPVFAFLLLGTYVHAIRRMRRAKREAMRERINEVF